MSKIVEGGCTMGTDILIKGGIVFIFMIVFGITLDLTTGTNFSYGNGVETIIDMLPAVGITLALYVIVTLILGILIGDKQENEGEEKLSWDEIDEMIDEYKKIKCPNCGSQELTKLVTPGFFECEDCDSEISYKELEGDLEGGF